MSRFTSHVLPYDPPGDAVADYAAPDTAKGYFAMGTTSWTGVVQLDYSLGWLSEIGIANIEAARQPLIQAVQTELRSRGYEPLTPIDSKTALVAFALKDARRKLADLMKVSKGEASKRWQEIEDRLELTRVGKQLRIALRS